MTSLPAPAYLAETAPFDGRAPRKRDIMGFWFLIGIVLTIAGLPSHFLNADALATFERLQRHIGRDVIVVDTTGMVVEGRVVAATSAGLDLSFGPHVRSFAPEAIWRVDRQIDSPFDGLLKGLVIGALLGAISRNAQWAVAMTATYGGLGYALDVGHRSREPIYRAPDPKAVKIGATIRW